MERDGGGGTGIGGELTTTTGGPARASKNEVVNPVSTFKGASVING
jgi:hypothetical protein